MLVTEHRFVCKRVVLVGMMHGRRMSRAKVQNPENPVAQKKRAYEKEREQPTSRSYLYIHGGDLSDCTA
jgi:hypothetical protein